MNSAKKCGVLVDPTVSLRTDPDVYLFVGEALFYTYTNFLGRVSNGCLRDFKFAETCSDFCTILYLWECIIRKLIDSFKASI